MLGILSKVFIFLILITTSHESFAEDSCVNGQIKIKVFSREKIEHTKYCFNQGKTNLYSINCQKALCIANKSFDGLTFDDLFSEYGNPGFSLCTKIGGKAQIIEFYADREWHSLDRCIFSKDTFLDTGLLLKYFKNQ